MGSIAAILTISRWEVKKVLSISTRTLLPISLVLIVALVLVSGFAAQSGVHLQDGIYRMGTDDPTLASLFSRDPRFSVYVVDRTTLEQQQYSFDLILADGSVYAQRTERATAALKALGRDYEGYVAQVYSSEKDLFAAYPLWIDQQYVQSELSFSATEGGQYLGIRPSTMSPYPEGPVEVVPVPLPTLALTEGDLRLELVKTAEQNDPFARYTSLAMPESGMGNVRVPSQLSPSLPFDSIIAVFLFIFPLYFLSQFFMMSIMGERLDRRGEPLLSTPLRSYQIIAGKALPYFLAMVAASLVLTFGLGGSPALLIPLLPIMLFFLASALLIAMLARSFKELSFISIFFSTLVTSYLFLPTIFAHIHIVSLISPLTLVIFQLEGESFTVAEYFYSTAFFYITSAVLFFVAMMNFHEERLFGQGRFLSRIREFIGSSLSDESPYFSLFLLNAFFIPFVFMAQMMLLVLFFNLPMPLSIVLLILTAALVEEVVKSLGVYTLFQKSPPSFSFPALVFAAGATSLGFLAGEKLFLIAMLSQITESIFGSVLFLSLQVLWLPFLLHFSAVLIVGLFLKFGGVRAYAPGIFLATLLHTTYNLSILAGVMG